MSFGDTYRTIALAPELVEPVFAALREHFAEELPDGKQTVRTIGAHWDDTEHTRKRAAFIIIDPESGQVLEGSTITGQPLTDGRVAFTALWQTDLMEEFDQNGLPGCEELTPDALEKLMPAPKDF